MNFVFLDVIDCSICVGKNTFACLIQHLDTQFDSCRTRYMNMHDPQHRKYSERSSDFMTSREMIYKVSLKIACPVVSRCLHIDSWIIFPNKKKKTQLPYFRGRQPLSRHQCVRVFPLEATRSSWCHLSYMSGERGYVTIGCIPVLY